MLVILVLFELVLDDDFILYNVSILLKFEKLKTEGLTTIIILFKTNI